MHSSRRKILVLNHFLSGNANVYRDYLFCFQAYSRHDFYYVHRLNVLKTLDLKQFDAILLFWACDWLRPRIGEEMIARIAEAPGKKLLFLQDEYRNVSLARKAINRFGVDQLFTLVHPNDYEAYYPKSACPGLSRIETVLTGYVPEELTKLESPRHRDRTVDVAYRSRMCPYYLGDLAQEKFAIAVRFQKLAAQFGLRHDISTWEGDRIYGRAYIDFLRNSRSVLGTESGASVVDFTGEIQNRCEEYLGRHQDATYEEVKQKFFADVDGKIFCRAISPRMFESTALGNALFLHEGDYSGILRPGDHYFALKKDGSNDVDAIAAMQDRDACERMARRAYDELIASGRYSYRTFVRGFDSVVDETVPILGTKAVSKARFYTHNFFRHGQGVIPHRDGYVRVPNVDLAASVGKRVINRVGLKVVRRLTSNPRTVWGLRAGVRLLLTHWWESLPQGARNRAYPLVRPLRRRLERTVFEAF